MKIQTWGRRLASMALCAAMLCGGTAAASSRFPDVPYDADYATAVRCLSELKVIVGFENGEFRPEDTVTRAQAAVIVCKLKGAAAKAKEQERKESPFEDVPDGHWAAGYIAVAERLNMISGYGDGRFGPDDTLTYAQMLSVLINVWGYTDMAKYSGGWPEGYLAVAREYGLIGNGVDGDAACPRSAVAQMCYRAMLVDGASWVE